MRKQKWKIFSVYPDVLSAKLLRGFRLNLILGATLYK
jgi:hypothetical protein